MPAEGGGDEQIVLPPFLSSPLPQRSVSSSCIDQPSHPPPSPPHSLDPSRYSIKQLRSSEGGGGRRRRRWRWTSVEKVTVALCDSEDSSAISTLATCLVNKIRRKLLSSSSAQSQTVMRGGGISLLLANFFVIFVHRCIAPCFAINSRAFSFQVRRSLSPSPPNYATSLPLLDPAAAAETAQLSSVCN